MGDCNSQSTRESSALVAGTMPDWYSFVYTSDGTCRVNISVMIYGHAHQWFYA
ncbi:anaerobic glycerol-3-phosphate dehydrogenase subunit B [Photobacterium profundum 3TCK]|uniref:Anaerobic glycerol-3-phosphate dehydrogenase subunit B n=1 Tax=Photobacterium profundum 3TCK TaxID=314280 RepID=Q1Z5A5_9GAMM|nr:anaerobic glycerol-3-phosphate dehydrogenase subunit B [Photobacterium profundum 3TCK]